MQWSEWTAFVQYICMILYYVLCIILDRGRENYGQALVKGNSFVSQTLIKGNQ